MNKTFVIADTHFGHRNIVKYCPIRRKYINEIFPELAYFDDTDRKVIIAMDNILIARWNDVVKADDKVYVLGDFTLDHKMNDNLINLIGALNGHKYLVRGNHDVIKSAEYVKAGFEAVYDGPILLWHYIFLSHEPMPHELIPEGYFNIFGHVHDYTGENWERGRCASVEQIEMKPFDITYMCQAAHTKFDKLQKEKKMAIEK